MRCVEFLIVVTWKTVIFFILKCLYLTNKYYFISDKMFVWVALVVILLLVCLPLWWQRHARRCFAHLPTYPQLPIVGNIHKFYGDGKLVYRRFDEISAISEQNNLPFVIWLGPVPALVLHNLDDIKVVTNNFVDKPYYYGFAKMWLGDGLITAPGEIWKRNIKKLAVALTGSVVDEFQNVFNNQARKLLASLKTEVDKAPFQLMEKYLAEITLEAICQTALGVPKISDSIVTQEYYIAFVRMIEIIGKRLVNIAMHPDFLFNLTSIGKEMKKCVAVIQNVSKTVLKKRQKQENCGDKDEHYDVYSENKKSKFKSFMDILLELNIKDSAFPTNQVRNEVDTIILAGQETVATTLFYTLLMIACKPRIQDKLFAEMREIFGESKRDVRKEDLARMSYCEAVIHESLRLYPPGVLVARYADRDLKIQSCTIPKGTVCAVNIYGVGRSKRYWGPDALEYKPERWQSASVADAALLAFSTGKRSCIGRKYAMAIMKTVVAHCVRELVLASEADKMELSIDLALRPVSGHLITVQLREQ